MNDSLKVIITEDKNTLSAENLSVFEEYNISPLFCTKDGEELLLKIISEEPDAVIMDLFMTRLDALGVMREVKKKDINAVVSNSMNVLSSIKFNDNILKTLLGDETSQLNEFEFNIFETTTTSTESDYLQALDKDEAEAEKDYVHDSDLIN